MGRSVIHRKQSKLRKINFCDVTMGSDETLKMDLNWIAIFIAFVLLSTGEAKDMNVQLTPAPEELEYAFWDNDGVCLNVDISANGGKAPYSHSIELDQSKEFNDTIEIQNDKLVYCAQTPNKVYGIKITTRDANNVEFETDLNITSSNLKVNIFPGSGTISENIHTYVLPDKNNFSLNLFKVGGVGQTNLTVTSNGIKYSPELPTSNYTFNNNTLIVNPNGLAAKSTYYLRVTAEDSRPVKEVKREYYLAFTTPGGNGNNQGGTCGNGNGNGNG
ncbi:hypothetical protein N9N67_08990, partial [Bacteriovoracaceae bacterium]|nr:hypothetical protein [Bacteriovoracaceae bacterium]